MNYFLVLLLTVLISPFSEVKRDNPQQAVLQSIFDIEEFQKYMAHSPRFVGTSTKQEILMMGFPELESENIELTVRNKTVRVITEEVLEELDHNFFIKIDEFKLKKSTAEVLLSYQNARMYYEKEQKVLMDAELRKNENDVWIVENYKLYEVNINTSD